MLFYHTTLSEIDRKRPVNANSLLHTTYLSLNVHKAINLLDSLKIDNRSTIKVFFLPQIKKRTSHITYH